MLPCSLSDGVGWVLDAKTKSDPIGLELLPCLLPGCEASGQATAVFSVYGRFRVLVRHPSDGTVMWLTRLVG